MSAAEPADPARAYVNVGAPGAVIDITKHHRRGGARYAAQGRWTMTAPPTPPDDGPGRTGRAMTPLELFANDVETAFNAMLPPRTLTDDDTAATFLKSLDVMDRVLEATHARGVINEKQLADLKATMAGLREAPRLV